MTKRVVVGILFGIFTVICLGFIWGNSITPGNESGQMSGSLTKWVNDVVQKVFPSLEITHKFVRKMAHFTEFAIFGALAFTNMLIWFPKIKRVFLLLSLPCCFLVALTDEFLQRFTAGRDSSFVDVMIDTLGATLAILVLFAIVILRDFSKKQARSDTKETVNT